MGVHCSGHKSGKAISGPTVPMVIHPSKRFNKMFINTLLTRKDECGFSFHQFKVDPGGEIPLHIHEFHQEAIYIISGMARIVVGGNVYEAGPGFLAYGQFGISIAIKNLANKPLHAIAVFCPPLDSEDTLWPDDIRWPEEQSPKEPF